MAPKAKARAKSKTAARKPVHKAARKTAHKTTIHAAAKKHARMHAGAKEHFLNAFDREHNTTVRVLRAYPHDKHELRPHGKSKSALELAWNFPMESMLAQKALTDGFDWTKPMPPSPPAPKSLDAIIAMYEAVHAKVADLIEDMSDDELMEPVEFPVAPRTIGAIPKIEFLNMLLADQIHHRGQFSVYLRMADAKVPSIYGPTADEPWM
jgi:hypothetical protein